VLNAVFRIVISLNADRNPDPGFYPNGDPDSGFRIPDPDPNPRSLLPKNKNELNISTKNLVFPAHFSSF